MGLSSFKREGCATRSRRRRRLVLDLLVLHALRHWSARCSAFGRQSRRRITKRRSSTLSARSLPKYTFFSLCRGFASYGLVAGFTLAYGTIAAHNRRAENHDAVLDVLQAIPVLGFCRARAGDDRAVPHPEIGLEIACIVMIFTGQAWNMVFSFHGSLRASRAPLREAAEVSRLGGGWKTFKLLELPAAMIGLVWN